MDCIANFIRYINVSLTITHFHKLTQDEILLISWFFGNVYKTSVDITSDGSVVHKINNIIALILIIPNGNVVLCVHNTNGAMVYVSPITFGFCKIQQSSVR